MGAQQHTVGVFVSIYKYRLLLWRGSCGRYRQFYEFLPFLMNKSVIILYIGVVSAASIHPIEEEIHEKR